jgi:hypothetical protein
MKTDQEIKKLSDTELENEQLRVEQELSALNPGNTTPLDQGNYPKDFEMKFDKDKEKYLNRLRTEQSQRKTKNTA